ncbi:Hypothetical predicted protein [Mytilus galloprovincialis]|uniref:Uncharacterized protein n=1 Tax=Mytilus galloprovincialis TaxID=29158 RepID=A0A8B6CSG5_MYTGA|nr:Hypothetical predicted protein [Mytilus galloprovincialis]
MQIIKIFNFTRAESYFANTAMDIDSGATSKNTPQVSVPTPKEGEGNCFTYD